MDRALARQAVDYVLARARGANWDAYGSNPRAFEITGDPKDLTPLDRCLYVELRPDMNARAHVDKLERIRRTASAAMRKGCANCEEMAFSAFMFLYERGIRPLEIMLCTPDDADHVFAVAGRPAGSGEHPGTWGPRSWIVDPWMAGFTGDRSEGAYPGVELQRRMGRRVPAMRGAAPWFRLGT